jgi:hypothetical protein
MQLPGSSIDYRLEKIQVADAVANHGDQMSIIIDSSSFQVHASLETEGVWSKTVSEYRDKRETTYPMPKIADPMIGKIQCTLA